MVKVINKTSHQRIYTLTDGSTLRVPAHMSSEPLEDKLICSHIKGDEEAGVVSVEGVSYTKTDNGTEDMQGKGGKK